MDYIEAGKRLAEIAKNAKWSITPVPTRMDGQKWDAAHYMIVIGEGVHAFNYSMGWGCFTPEQIGKAHDRAPWGNVGDTLTPNQKYLNNNFMPKPNDILCSMARDAQGSDCNFDEWCDDHGYNNDSMSDKKMWEACNQMRRALKTCFSTDELPEIYECANEM